MLAITWGIPLYRKGLVIVETGTTRSNLGFSTHFLARIAKGEDGVLCSVDCNPKSLAFSRTFIANKYPDLLPFIQFHKSSSIAYLNGLPLGSVDLAYLDSAPDPETIFSEAQAIFPALRPGAGIVIDDTEKGKIGPQGKGSLAIPWLQAQGFDARSWASSGKRVTALRRIP